MPRAILIAEPDDPFAAQLVAIVHQARWLAVVCSTFELARETVEHARPDLVVTNVRLGLYNGIQLCYLSKRADPAIPVVVYGSAKDLGSAADAQQACGLFERQQFLPRALPSYLNAIACVNGSSASHPGEADSYARDAAGRCPRGLPERDRRNPQVVDRRVWFRGGRRSTDVPELHPERLPPPNS
jgi:hypothetical protein